MNLFHKSAALTVLTGLGMLAGVGKAQAYDYHHIDSLAVRLQRQAENLHREVHLHFRNTPRYRHIDSDVTSMERLARHIHDVAHHSGHIRHVRSDVEQLDRLFHHIEEMVAHTPLDYVTRSHFNQDMYRISRTLHHLRDDLRHADHFDPHFGHGGHGHGVFPVRRGLGISFGGRNFRVLIRP